MSTARGARVDGPRQIMALSSLTQLLNQSSTFVSLQPRARSVCIQNQCATLMTSSSQLPAQVQLWRDWLLHGYVAGVHARQWLYHGVLLV